ncbi:MAG: hypothetical protein R2702_14075 [Acidimicrobiales bacterium]
MDLLVIATGEDGFGGLSDGSDGPVCTPSSAGSGRFAGLVVGATVELRGAGDVVRATGALSALTEAVATAEIDALRCRWTATLGPVDEDDAYALVVDGQAIATVRGPARARFDLVL